MHSPKVCRPQLQIARDEAEHADLAWEVLAFALERGAEPAREAVIAARDAGSPPVLDSAHDALRAFGCMPADDIAMIASRVHQAARSELNALLA